MSFLQQLDGVVSPASSGFTESSHAASAPVLEFQPHYKDNNLLIDNQYRKSGVPSPATGGEVLPAEASV